MKSVILAAGPGSRLGIPRPKVLLEIGGRTLLHRHLEILGNRGPVVVAAGFGRSLLPDPGIEIVSNTDWESTGTLASLLACGPAFDDGSGMLLTVHGDLLWSRGILEKTLGAPGDIVVPIDRRSGGAEAMKVLESADRLRLMSKDLEEGTHCGESVGLFLFRRRGIDLLTESGPGFLEDFRAAMVDHFLNSLAGRGVDVRIADITGEAWDEIDTPADLRRAEHAFS